MIIIYKDFPCIVLQAILVSDQNFNKWFEYKCLYNNESIYLKKEKILNTLILVWRDSFSLPYDKVSEDTNLKILKRYNL